MKRKSSSRRSNCPVACALDLLGDRWTLVVLRDLIIVRKRYFQELLEGNEGIATNILTSRLKLLEAAGLVTRRPDPGPGRRVLYAPTVKAVDLLPVLIELIHWSLKYSAGASAPDVFLQRLAADRAGFIADLRAAHGVS